MKKESILFIVFLLFAFTEGSMAKDNFTYGSIEKTLPAQWQQLSHKKIFFGHKSVGNNILDGVQEILQGHAEIRLAINKLADSVEMQPGVLTHDSVGKNGNPSSKIQDFVAKLNSGIGAQADVALFKFCFVDITSKTDVHTLFSEYRDAMAVLKHQFPNTTFVHITTPLMWREPNFPKGMIKRLLGMGGESDNISRNSFNELLRNEYQGKEPIFDLAKLEAIRSDGSVAGFIWQGNHYPALVNEYTDDGGHLSAKGRKIIAEQLLVFLASL